MEIFCNIVSIFNVIKNQFKVSLLYKSYIFNCLIKLLNGSVSWYTFYIKKKHAHFCTLKMTQFG